MTLLTKPIILAALLLTTLAFRATGQSSDPIKDAQRLTRLGQIKYAEFVYRILIRDYPEFALAYDSLAVSLSKSDRPREAIPFHQKAISLDPKDASFYYNLAVSYLVLGDSRKAAQQQQALRNLDPVMAEHLGA